MRSITHPHGPVASPSGSNWASSPPPEQKSGQIRGVPSDLGHPVHSTQGTLEGQEPNTLLIEDLSLYHGFVQLPKLVLYARNLSRDAKLLYAVLLGYAWQEQRCFPGYKRLCDDMDASENMVRKYMRELEAVHLLSQRRRGQGRTNLYILHDLRTAKIEVQDHHKIAVLEPQESKAYEETENKELAEPLYWLKPGGSGRDHRPLCAALASIRYSISALRSD